MTSDDRMKRVRASVDDHMARLRASVDDRDGMDAAAADRLEAALRVAHAERSRPAAVPGWRRPALLGAMALVVVLAALATMVVQDTAPSAALVLRDASGVTVVLPDGSRVVDPVDGFELPDGAVVSIADGGRATIDDTTIDVASVLEVRDGALVAQVDVTTTRPDDRVPTDQTTDRDSSDQPTDQPSSTTLRDATTTSEPGTSDRPPTTDAPAPFDRPTAPDGERSDASGPTTTRPNDRSGGETPPTTVVPPAPEPDPHAAIDIGLRVQRVDSGIGLRWVVIPLADGWQVVVQRQIGDAAVETITGPSTAAEGETIDPLDVPVGGDQPRVRYRVAVLDDAGGLVGAGPYQSVRR